MKHIKRLLAAGLLLAIAFSLSGCIPPHYTKEHKKEILNLHKDEAAAWFAANYPAAVFGKDCEAASSSIDLYAALNGTYTVNGDKHAYIYDYTTDTMYLNEDYQAALSLLRPWLCEAAGVSAEQTEFYFSGLDIPLLSENDDGEPSRFDGVPQGEPLPMTGVGFLPAFTDPAAFAQEAFLGNTDLSVSLFCYTEHFPAYDASLFDRAPILAALHCTAPVSTEYCGPYSARYTREGMQQNLIHLTQLEDGLYGGYYYPTHFTGDGPGFDDRLEYTRDSAKHFTLTIPDEGRPILFSTKKLRLTNHFTNRDGKEMEFKVDGMSTEKCPGLDGFTLHDVHFLFPSAPKLYGYQVLRNVSAEGVYQFKIK